ncbi:MAG: hypothetical protein KDD47_01090 [Acidobacteria bacterium]|nr:hypothetical protein [Acidobacteriota bacterium]
MRSPIEIEGLEPDELLALRDDEFETLILHGQPVAFRAGTAEVLGQFEIDRNRLVVELAHIDGGGEGVLLTLVALARRYASSRSVPEVEWMVYATNCARPNPKLLRVLRRRGYVLRTVEGKGECYYRRESIASSR